MSTLGACENTNTIASSIIVIILVTWGALVALVAGYAGESVFSSGRKHKEKQQNSRGIGSFNRDLRPRLNQDKDKRRSRAQERAEKTRKGAKERNTLSDREAIAICMVKRVDSEAESRE